MTHPAPPESGPSSQQFEPESHADTTSSLTLNGHMGEGDTMDSANGEGTEKKRKRTKKNHHGKKKQKEIATDSQVESVGGSSIPHQTEDLGRERGEADKTTDNSPPLEKTQALLREKQLELSKAEDGSRKFKELNKKLNDLLVARDEEINVLEQQNKVLKEQKSSSDEECAKLFNERESIRKYLSQTQDRLRSSQEQLQCEQESNAGLRRQITTKKQECEKMCNLLRDSKATITSTSEECEQKTHQLFKSKLLEDDLREQIKGLTEKLTKKDYELQSLFTQNERNKSAIETLQSEVLSKDTRISEYESEVEGLKQQIRSLEADRNSNAQLLLESTRAVEESATQAREKTRLLRENDDAHVKQLVDCQEALEGLTKTFAEERKTKDKHISELEAEVANLEEKYTSLEKDLEEKSAKSADEKRGLQALVESAITSKGLEIEQLAEKIRNQELSIERLSNDNKAKDDSIAELEGQSKNLIQQAARDAENFDALRKDDESKAETLAQLFSILDSADLGAGGRASDVIEADTPKGPMSNGVSRITRFGFALFCVLLCALVSMATLYSPPSPYFGDRSLTVLPSLVDLPGQGTLMVYSETCPSPSFPAEDIWEGLEDENSGTFFDPILPYLPSIPDTQWALKRVLSSRVTQWLVVGGIHMEVRKWDRQR